MKRTAYNQLLAWKQKENRKPLIIKGARQVGKTWLMKEFGKKEYETVAYINFEKETLLSGLFESDFDIQRILSSIQLVTGIVPNTNSTLIIFDEIQAVKRGLLALKYFYEDAPEYHIIAAGSLLGISVHKGESFPVGKINFLNLFPLSFEEFLMALNQQDLLNTLYRRDWFLIKTFRNKYINLLRQYYYIGGMPEVVTQFVQNGNYQDAREIQNSILESYNNDFSKHPPLDIVPRIKMVWNALPSQLAKENRKFIFGSLKTGGRAKEFELAIMWLEEAGVIHKINRVSNVSLPLNGFEEHNAFKLFMADTGLLAAKAGLDATTLLSGNAFFAQYKGALTEQFVLQQLKPSNIPIYYWSAKDGKAEVDFLIQNNNAIIPIEVKAEENLKSKSLKSFRDRYHPSICVRSSMSDFRVDAELTNIPLYSIGLLQQIINIL